MKKLTDKDIIRLMREEWNDKVETILEASNSKIKFDAKVEDENKQIIDKDLKVRHKESKLLYTIVALMPNAVVLRAYNPPNVTMDVNPALQDESEVFDFAVDEHTLSKEYELD